MEVTILKTNLCVASAQNVDFMIHGLIKYKFFGHTVWITTSHACLLITVLTIIIFSFVVKHKMKNASDVPGTFQNIVEAIVDALDGIVKGSMGKNAVIFRNYMETVMVFIFFSNYSGLLGLRPPTADYGTTLALALITFFMIRYNKYSNHNIKELWEGMTSPMPPWLPLWMPINIISEIAIPISLSLRLFANILSGVIIEALTYGMLSQIAYVWPAVLHVYFDMFSGAVQTYVFIMLTMTYVNQAVDNEDEDENEKVQA